VERDADILGEMGQAGLAQAGYPSPRWTPRSPAGWSRAARRPRGVCSAIERLAAAGCPVRVMVSPIIPGLTDHELEGILKAARDAGAVAASSIPLRLPLEVSELWQDWLAEHYPDRLGRVMTKIRDMHGGRDYDPEWGKRMTGEGLWADLCRRGFDVRSRLWGSTPMQPNCARTSSRRRRARAISFRCSECVSALG
jgi:DNA repair photolyase